MTNHSPMDISNNLPLHLEVFNGGQADLYAN